MDSDDPTASGLKTCTVNLPGAHAGDHVCGSISLRNAGAALESVLHGSAKYVVLVVPPTFCLLCQL